VLEWRVFIQMGRQQYGKVGEGLCSAGAVSRQHKYTMQ
jgi:hypothetical protein